MNKKYDLIILGGGSGGISCAKEASKQGAKVLVIDSRKGLGGTCVNVGCVPKKLLYQASAMINDNMFNLYGWDIKIKKHNWKRLINNIHNYIKKINNNYIDEFKKLKIDYINGYGKYIDPYTIECNTNTKKIIFNCKKSVIAVGGKPKKLGIEGEEHCITSDELFNMKTAPGKTLIIGAGYIALECAGFIKGLGNDVNVMVRSEYLRGFDRECVNFVVQNMKNKGILFIDKSYPVKIEKDKKKIKVYYIKNKIEYIDTFDTVLLAVGRVPFTDYNTIGLKTNALGYIISNSKSSPGYTEGTSHPDIFAVGDILESGIELTPVAIMAGKLLAKRLFGNTHIKMDYTNIKMDYTNIPTTIFTPLEYSSIGITNEEAIAKYGNKITVYNKYYNPVSLTDNNLLNFYKIILVNSKIIGIHIVGKNSSEIIQGFSLSIKYNLPLFDNLIGIHPTSAEELFNLTSNNC